MNMMRRFLSAILLILSAGVLAGADDPAVTDAAVLVNAFRDAMYLQQIDDASLNRMYRITLADLGDLPLDERELLFRKAEAAFYMARGYQALDSVEAVLAQDGDLRKGKFKKLQKSYSRLDEIVTLYEESMDLSEAYLAGGRDARGIRLYTEALSQTSTLKTLGFLMSNGTRIQPLAEEAVELDPREIKAHMLLASRYIYSPGIWGGDPDRGIAMMEEIIRIGGLDREDEHNINVGIGFAHTMAERWEEAIPFFQKALDIYPGNIYASAMLELSESGGSK
jgi:tetratricopeptide (TPR) repeat protein